jgi:hypothetical protein
MALLGLGVTFDLSPQSAAKQTQHGHRKTDAIDPNRKWRAARRIQIIPVNGQGKWTPLN